MKKINWKLIITLIIVSVASGLNAQTTEPISSNAKPLNEADLIWGEAPPSLPKGAKLVVLAGDPSKAGPVTMRAMFPANYTMAAHTHGGVENVTVLKGTLYVGMGDKVDLKTATLLKPGGFYAIPTTGPHYAFTNDGCVFEVHTMGPFVVNYANASDDPSKQK